MSDVLYIGDEFILKCIESGELQLTKNEWWSHFIPVFFLMFVAISFLSIGFYKILTKIFTSELILSDFSIIFYALLFILTSYLIYRMQKNVLRFFSVTTDESDSSKRNIVNSVGKKMNWKKVFEDDNIIIGKTPLSSYSWGEQITIIFYQDKVFVNSICDPDKKTSIIGPNHKNVMAFFNKFEKTKRMRTEEISD